MNTYFELDWDPDFPSPWWLDEVECETSTIDCRIFTDGRPQTIEGPLRVPIKEEGEALDLTFAAFSVPIVSRTLGDVFARYAPEAVQRLPVKVGDIASEYEVLNVTRTCDALDLVRGQYLWWQPGDHRADKVGTLRAVYQMVFRPDIHPPPHLFRVKGWEIALVVSGALMAALVGAGLRGNKFRPIKQ